MLAINQTVISKTNGKGIIIRIITKSTGYVEVRYESGTVKKEMAFNLTDEKGNALKNKPKKKERVITTADKIDSVKCGLMRANELPHSSLLEAYDYKLNRIKTENDFIESLINTYFDTRVGIRKISEKQAYYLAKFIVENNL